MAETIEYKNYIIEPLWSGGFQFIHKEYDGPGDTRYGFYLTVEECKAAIDEMEESGGRV